MQEDLDRITSAPCHIPDTGVLTDWSTSTMTVSLEYRYWTRTSRYDKSNYRP